MDIDKDTLLEIYQYYGSKDLKQLQSKLTKTANGLLRDTVQSRVAPLFTPKETEILTEAAYILRGFRNKVEHAKEVKARQEQQQVSKRQRLDQAGFTLAQRHFSVAPDDFREMLLVYLAVARLTDHNHQDVAHAMDRPHNPNAIEHYIRDCYQEALRAIGYQSHHDARDEPDETLITQARQRFETSRGQLTEQHQALLDRLAKYQAIQTTDNVTRLNPKR